MKALSFQFSWPRLAAAKVLGALVPGGNLWPLGPLTYEEVPDPSLKGDDWVILEVDYSGICGSDVKQVFLEGAIDNPLTALISFPHVPGHEAVGTIVETGRGVTRLRKGQRVAVYPWISCAVRGLPPCMHCEAGEIPLCKSQTLGAFAPGMHAGVCRDVAGGFAPLLAAHQSMCFPLPDSLALEPVALADPFSVCLHAVQKAPPTPGDTAVVIGMGSLGMLLGHLLVRLFPGVRVVGVDVHAEMRPLAAQLGIEHFIAGRGPELVDALGALTGAPLIRPWRGLPFLNGGVDRVYDTVGSGRSLELGIRVLRSKGSLVLVGVAPPERFEWTPIYFKELQIIGSNGCAVEHFDGERRHSFDIFLRLLEQGRIAPEPVITHRLPLHDYRSAFSIARHKERHQSVKVLFAPKEQRG